MTDSNLQKKIKIILNLFKSKKLNEAESFCRETIKSYPTTVILYNILGLILTNLKKMDEAILCYEQGIKIKPDYAMFYNNLGSIYKSKENYLKSEDCFKKAINLDPKLVEAYNNLGNLYLTLNKYEKSILSYQTAIKINKKFFIAQYNIAVVFKNIGKFKEAEKHLKLAVEYNPMFYTAHRILSQITKYTKNNKHLNSIKNIYFDNKINKSHKAEIAFALGKAFDDIKDYKKAFKYYTEGNDLRRKNISFSLDRVRNEFNDIKNIFNKNLFKKTKLLNDYKITPIFILGMPRSGTTLIEQILSSHPKVFGGDELNFLPKLVEKYFNIFQNDITKNKFNLEDYNYNKIGDEYIKMLKTLSNKNQFITDKLPINFIWIGLIKIVLPKSIIIHCLRNPKDNCLSIFKNYFVNPKLNFAYKLDEIVEFYNLYSDLMKHWKNIFPESIHDVKYENLINNPKKNIQSMLKFSNVEWDDRCMKFYQNKRAIKTASDSQARKKIYKTSVNSWKNYKNDMSKYFSKLNN